MNAHVDLLRAARAKSFAALATRKLSARDIRMRVTVVHETASVWEILTANGARNRFVAMRLHVAFEPRLVVERFSAFQTGMVFLFGMVPCVFQQRSLVLAMLATQSARVFGQFFRMHRRYVRAYVLLLRETLATQHTLEHDGAGMDFGVRQQIQCFGKCAAAHIAAMIFARDEVAARRVGLIVAAHMTFQQVQSMERHAAHVAIVIAEFRIGLFVGGRLLFGLVFRATGHFFAVLRSLMLLQLFKCPEHVAATVTLERIVHTVDEEMGIQCLLAGKTDTAHLANERANGIGHRISLFLLCRRLRVTFVVVLVLLCRTQKGINVIQFGGIALLLSGSRSLFRFLLHRTSAGLTASRNFGSNFPGTQSRL